MQSRTVRVSKLVICLYLTLLLLVIFVIFIVIELNKTLLLLVICYLIMSNFTASSILSYLLYDGLSETPKIEVLCIFIARLLLLSIKHNLEYQLCPGCKPFLIFFFLKEIDWKKKKPKEKKLTKKPTRFLKENDCQFSLGNSRVRT